MLRFCGRNLQLRCMAAQSVVVEGYIMSMEFLTRPQPLDLCPVFPKEIFAVKENIMFIVRLFRWLCGYVEFEVTGNFVERFQPSHAGWGQYLGTEPSHR